MITRAYSRCNGGHYFMGACCPLDGWSSAASRELAAACQKLTASGRPVSLASLREAGVSESSLSRIIVIEFGSAEGVFDAVSPEGYVVMGRWQPLEELGDAFT
jgi:hypothetical protein